MSIKKSLLRLTKERPFYRSRLRLSSSWHLGSVPPRHAAILVTNHCNSRCRYCDCWHHNDETDTPAEKLLETVDALHRLKVRKLVISGGEPLLRKNDVVAVIRQAKYHRMTTGLITNGILLTPEVADLLAQAGLGWLELSLDSLDPAVYQEQRGISLDKVKCGLATLDYLRERWPKVGRTIHTVLSKQNLTGILPLVEYAQQRGISVGLQPVHRSTFKNAGEEDTAFAEDDAPVLEELCRELVDLKRSGARINNSEIYLRHLPAFSTLGTMPEMRCLTGYLFICIDADLAVWPCWSLPPVGNLRERELKEIWFSREFREQRRDMANLKCPGCGLNCHIEPSLAYQPVDLVQARTTPRPDQNTDECRPPRSAA